ncbi:MAG: phage baseplate assembly protein V, partial [Pseudomonadota bacterium]
KKMGAVVDNGAVSLATSREVEGATLTTATSARLARMALSAIQGRCAFAGSALAKPGAVIELKNLGERFGGSALISVVEHKIEAGAWTTEASLGLADGFVADGTAFAGMGARELATPIHGLQIGKVEKLSEDPDKKLRIKVRLPMVGVGGTSVWARYSTPYASNGAGIQFMPEIDDEVVVAFLNADPHAPVVLGSVHSGKLTQPEAVGDENNYLKTIKTLGALQLQFDDEKKIVTLKTPGGHKLTMDDDAGEVKLECSNGNSVTMSSSGVAIDSAGSVDITASTTANVTAGTDATLSGTNVTCKADAAVEANGGATAKLEGGGQTTVKGAVVMIN